MQYGGTRVEVSERSVKALGLSSYHPEINPVEEEEGKMIGRKNKQIQK